MFKLFSILLCIAITSWAQPSNPRRINLEEALDLAHKNNLSFMVSQTKLDKAHAMEDQANAAKFPKLIGTAIVSPIYKATGNALSTETDTRTWGAWLQSTLTILQPLYTWGKLSSYREAAERNLSVTQAEIISDRNQLDYDVKEVYYGAVLLEQLYKFLDDGKKDLEEVEAKAEEDQTKKHPKIAKRDFYRLKVFLAEARYRWEEAKKLRTLSHHAFSLRLGFDSNEETLPKDTVLIAIDREPPQEAALIKLLLTKRPELEQLNHGIAAKQALLAAEKTNKFPMIFAGGMLTYAYSNVRSKQDSAFAFDPYNRTGGGVGLGLQWNFDFKTTLANESALQAEILELERKQAYALQGFRLELKKSLADLNEARARLTSSKQAFDIGRKWLISESMNYSVGLGDVKDLIDAYLARAKTAKDYWESSLKVNMAWANLIKTLGTELTEDKLP